MSAVRQIVAIGGGVLVPESGNFKLERYILDACGREKPRVAFVPTASGDDPAYIARFYESYGRFGARLDTLRFFRRTPVDLRAYLAEVDVVHVGGGNTRSMLAVWRHYGFDTALHEAWTSGVLLCGSSAGSICWFESGVTDSLAGDLTTMAGLGLVAGSNCPHYDGEAERRPAYRRFVETGALGDGIACDDGAAVHARGDEPLAFVSARPNARAYRVARDGAGAASVARETPVDVRSL
ncbi:MAG: Type 1 glutamine amidotransferase-like domain-containing protein [Vulcanimicrobiaceae bacterium]